MFNYDWFHGTPFEQQQEEAKRRCTISHFSDVDPETFDQHEEILRFHSELETRSLVYLRDGFSYEIRQLADVATRSLLVFECVPVDESYKAGAFVVAVPFEEVVRVEVFAVHPSEKPEDLPQITGFRTFSESGDYKYADNKPGKSGR